jgi:hypothetical protein
VAALAFATIVRLDAPPGGLATLVKGAFCGSIMISIFRLDPSGLSPFVRPLQLAHALGSADIIRTFDALPSSGACRGRSILITS